MRILLVDDDQDIRFALAKVFKAKHKYTVVEACSGLEAIATLTEQKDFALIISDFQMDNGNGDVIVEFLKAQNSTVPFIFFSGSQEVKSAQISTPVLRCFSKSEIFHLIEYVEQFAHQSARRAIVS